MSKVLRASTAMLVGITVGYLGSFYGRYTAQAAVKVRPNLADVGFVQAALTNHGTDWLFYHYPIAMTVVTMVFLAGVAAGVGWGWIKRGGTDKGVGSDHV